jgi:5-methylcytosine-specific restriction endonuclease McrA
MEITRYPEGFTGADLRRKLGIKEKPSKTTVKRRKREDRKIVSKSKQARALALNKFWGMWSQAKTYEAKIGALRWAERQRFDLRCDMDSRREYMRQQFNKHKRKLFVLDGHQDCRVCERSATARHHIIALNNGGRNQTRNIMYLCSLCHLAVHPWMKVNVNEMAETMARVEREL